MRLYAALSITAAVRQRDSTGHGSRITLPLEDVALATAGTLGYLTEVQVNGRSRESGGNAVYGTYGIDFVSSDNERFMIVALTTRHFRDLASVTGTTAAVDAVEAALGADFSTEADRYRHREVLTALFSHWFREHSGAEIAAALDTSSVLFERYRSFEEVVKSGELENNPMFSALDQPRIGSYLAAANPASFDGAHLYRTRLRGRRRFDRGARRHPRNQRRSRLDADRGRRGRGSGELTYPEDVFGLGTLVPRRQHVESASETKILRDDGLHDFTCATVDSCDTRVCVKTRDGILGDVAVPAVQLEHLSITRPAASVQNSFAFAASGIVRVPRS